MFRVQAIAFRVPSDYDVNTLENDACRKRVAGEVNMDAQQLKGHLDLLLLASLEQAPRYGGQIIADVQAATDGYFNLREGTLYPALHRLERAGWIMGEFQQLPRGGSPVKVYALTPAGRQELKAQRERFERFSGAVRGIIGGAV